MSIPAESGPATTTAPRPRFALPSLYENVAAQAADETQPARPERPVTTQVEFVNERGENLLETEPERPGTELTLAEPLPLLESTAEADPEVDVVEGPTDDTAEPAADEVDTDTSSLDALFELPAAGPEPEVAVAVEKSKKFRTFSLIDPDRRWVMVVAMIVMTSVLVANLVASFTNVYAMSAWIGLPAWAQFMPVVILDVALVGFSWGLMVFKSRGAAVLRTRFYIGVVTGFSVVANFMHTYDFWHGDLTTPQAKTGIVLSSAIPLMSLVVTEELIRLVFKLRDRRKKKQEVSA